MHVWWGNFVTGISFGFNSWALDSSPPPFLEASDQNNPQGVVLLGKESHADGD